MQCSISANLSPCCIVEEGKIWRKDGQAIQEQNKELADVGILFPSQLRRPCGADEGHCPLARVSVGGSVDANFVVARSVRLLVTRDRCAGALGGTRERLGCSPIETGAERGGMVADSVSRVG